MTRTVILLVAGAIAGAGLRLACVHAVEDPATALSDAKRIFKLDVNGQISGWWVE